MINAGEKVTEALATYYWKREGARNAGYNIMRYAEMGYIKVDSPYAGQAFVDCYPLPSAYVILELASQGLLSYLPKPEDKNSEYSQKTVDMNKEIA